MFSYPAHRQIPNLVIAAPKDEQELRSLVRTALAQDHPFALNYRVTPASGCPSGRRRSSRWDAARSCGGTDILLVGFGPIVARGLRGRRRARCRWLVGRRDQRALPQADGPPAHPRPGAREAPRCHARGEHGDRRVRLGGPSKVLEEARLRIRPTATSRFGSWASPGTGSSTTARSLTLRRLIRSTAPGSWASSGDAGPAPRGASSSGCLSVSVSLVWFRFVSLF